MKLSDTTNTNWLKDTLESLYDRFNRASFIESDPISVPHAFGKKEDIEIAGFLTALISWGQRPQIIRSANLLMQLMDNDPSGFVIQHSERELNQVSKFYYRTFNVADLKFILKALRELYSGQGGMEAFITNAYRKNHDWSDVLCALYSFLKEVAHEERSMKHIANISNGSAAKRLNMYFRWMVRQDNRGVDFGLWKQIPASVLYIPLDVHSGRTAREFGLLTRNQNDWKAVLELTENLRKFDENDPVKYDFALFGFGILQKEP